jgi:hypothetical protein
MCEVEVMVLHAASAVAGVADQMMQAPFVVQCVQAVPEPKWKWWLTLFAAIFGTLLSTVGSIYVAWRVFRWQGVKDRRAWIRDQQRAEWSAILSGLTAVEIRMPHVFSNLDWPKLTGGVLQEMRNVIPAMRNAIFVAEELEKTDLIAAFANFVSEAALKLKAIDDLNHFISDPSGLTEVADIAALNKVKIHKMEKRSAVYTELHDDFHELSDRIRKIARADLNLATENSE